jgi:hypothetical protein
MTPQERYDEAEQLDIETCAAVIRFSGYGPTAIDPPEYCDNEVEPGSEYCRQHQGYEDQ